MTSAAFATLCFLTAACSLDWNVRPDPGDASVAEAAADATTDTTMPVDASSDAVDAPTGIDGADCTALANDVTTTKTNARACQLSQSGTCTTTVKDECGCDVVITKAGSAEATAYADAVAALIAACGKPACAACPQLPLMASWKCLANAGVYECFP